MDWNDVRLFLSIARSRTLVGAAPELGISQPTAGRRLRAFEEAMGTTLFQRTPHGLQLTGDGEAILKQAERVETEMLGLLRSVTAEDAELEGELRISTSEWFANTILTKPLTSFAVTHPLITMELLGDTRLYDLSRREADMVFRFQKFDMPDVVQSLFVKVRYGVYASNEYIERQGVPDTAGEGEGHRIVAMDRAHGQLADVPWLLQRLPRATYSFRSNSRDMQAVSCAAGGGVSVLPKVLGERFGLVELWPDEPPPGRDVWLGYHSDLRRVARLRAIIDHLRSTVPKEV
ncbi:DNA-binding transcriptional LysR family regulator [Rhizobium leguminosarum]|uniref:DNA-binding transcriptional LysR family regulator n=1 Tax=Rhizobium leguminosarum TaxID=384 RepID=A0AAE2MHR9_RHILE|nr:MULTISPECIES: LysR family transcriptional regulator [Rhizobium]MBB4289581.1 DNA-binding transcriptional LysR family regulator [Rhizobium leguminosarum]MBB4296225.1 DNA-binding transcriptional LysR family regulator [Rhizobium leguminosarum]MBB4308515.1 DNA-binding transcriptional LysR family regulator [Rhizobium leguminosarum]MBB4416351.1 DNA-binding transcriptional LysR family regulator [Rhizobium leguminosarum]MBB4430682.1 DNA-binding transcriptional LysR family regulator [Rhizobium espera